jgi:hypothetical protein
MLDRNGLTEIFAIYYYVELHQQRHGQSEMDISVFEEYSGAASSIGVKEFKELYLEVREQLQLLFTDKKA